MSDKQRIIDLQKQVKIARSALEQIGHGHARSPDNTALEALDEMRPLDRVKPIAGLLGWEKRP